MCLLDNIAFDPPAIPPPISVEAFDTTVAVYTVNNMKSAYDIEDGNEFNIICKSSGIFSGRVTWINNGMV
jgi:hypothetical protein